MVSERRTDFEKTDIVMLVLVVVLTVFGLAMLLSASEYNGRVRFGDSAYYFKKQLFAAALGLGIMYLIIITILSRCAKLVERRLNRGR